MGSGEKLFLSIMVGLPLIGVISAVAIPALLHQRERARANAGEVLSNPPAMSQPANSPVPLAPSILNETTTKGFIELSGSYPVSVKVDGSDMGQLPPGGKLNLEQGSHEVEAQNTALFLKDTRIITVGAGQVSTLALPGVAAITVETFPGTGRIFVDEIDSGIESDGSSVNVTHGTHTFLVKSTKGSSDLVKTNISGPTSLRFPQFTATSIEGHATQPINSAPGDTPPKVVTLAPPVSPKRAIQMRWEPNQDHVVRVKVFVGEQGQPLKVSVIEGVAGGYGFDEAAIEAANTSTYSPAIRNGKPVRGWTSDLVFRFSRQR